ncbi:MAG: mechanosensitive ion channel [Holophagae bacterium]|jgi:hypothetical protein
MQQVFDYLRELVTANLGQMLIALAILVIGWLVALVSAALVRRGLKRTAFDNRIAQWLAGAEKEERIEVELWAGRFVFWLLMLFVLLAFFEALGLRLITEPLNHFLSEIVGYFPNLIGPAILLVIAWGLATGLRFVVRRVLDAIALDDRLNEGAGIEDEDRVSISSTVSEAVYWLVFLLFLPAILGALQLEGLLEPVQTMVDEVLAFVPNLLAAALILAAGWLLARIIQRLVSNLLAAAGADRLADQTGVATALGEKKLSGLIGLVLYVLILIPVLIAALNTLRLDAITAPASDMLRAVLAALPLLFGAALLLTIAFLVGRVVAGLVANVLAGIGFNGVLERLGIGREPDEGRRTPSEIVGHLVLVALMLFATIEAMRLLGFDALAGLMTQFMIFAGHVALGLVIFGFGLYLGNLAARTIEASRSAQAPLLALAARLAVLVLAGAMALREMGLANEIITLAFGLLLGAIAVATALAFGLGCRDMAADAMSGWIGQLSGERAANDQT